MLLRAACFMSAPLSSNASGGKPAVLITGASRGIGAALADEFARHGHDLILVARSREELDALAACLAKRDGIRTTVMVADLTLEYASQELFDAVQGEGLEVDVLVNNAGFGNWGDFAETDLQTDVELLEVNMTALTKLTKLFLRPMVERNRGRIVNVASTGAFQPGPHMATYYASKAYVLSFSEAIAEELRGTGITVTCLCPGATRTAFMEQAGMGRLRLFRFGMMTSDAVARVGYRGAMRGKKIVIPGMSNRLGAFAVPFAPRGFVTRLVGWLMDRQR